MQKINFMQENMADISKMLGEGLPPGIFLDEVKYSFTNINSQWVSKRRPGLIVKYRYDNAHEDGFYGAYGIEDYPDLDKLTKAIHADIFFMNISMNYPHLGVGDYDYATDSMRVHANGKSVVLRDLNRFYDDEACVLHVDKFVRAVNVELKARYDAKNHPKWSPFHHQFKPFAPWHAGDVDIKALFEVKQSGQVELAKVTL